MRELDEKLKEIKDQVFNCKKCSLYKTRINPVIGEGNHNANIVFIGEAPGAQEDRKGKPFCGRSGNILDELLKSVGINREDIYIANILKCRPPENRNPKREEIEACTHYLEEQINIINPKVVCTLGNYATAYILERYGLKEKVDGISKIHGRIFVADGLFSSIKIIPLYHPAVATYNSNMIDSLKKDFNLLNQFK